MRGALLFVLACYQPATLSSSSPSPYNELVIGDGAIGYWPLDDADGPDIAELVHGVPATALNGCTFGVPGAIGTGTAIEFGSDCTIDVGSAFDFGGTAPFSVEAWAQIASDDTDPYRSVFTRETRRQPGQGGGPIDGYALLYHSPTAVVVERAANNANVQTNDANVDAAFHHLVLTYEAPTLSMFVDGALVQDRTDDGVSVATSTVHGLIGAASASEGYLRGVIDEVAIYDHALPSDRVLAHYEAR